MPRRNTFDYGIGRHLTFCVGKTDVDANCVHMAQKMSHVLDHELAFVARSDDIVRCRRDARRCQSELL